MSEETWRAVKLAFTMTVFSEDCSVCGAKFDESKEAHWRNITARYKKLVHKRKPSIPKKTRRDNMAAFGYTDKEAHFCDRFDSLADTWERDQQKWVDGHAETVACDCRCNICDELKPPWMAKLVIICGTRDEWPLQIQVHATLCMLPRVAVEGRALDAVPEKCTHHR